MMHWLPGPEAGLRWLHQVDADAKAGLWSEYSNVPLGISSYYHSGRRVTHQRSNTAINMASARAEEYSPPMWAASVQRLEWVKRRELEPGARVGIPVWERPADVVLDLRECFGGMINDGLVTFTENGARRMQHGESADVRETLLP